MAETGKPEEPAKTGITMADIRKLVTDTIAEATKGITHPAGKEGDDKDDTARPGTRADRGASVASQVEAEIAKIKAKEAQEARDKGIDDQLSKLSEATAEKTPVERGKMHRFMGWGE
jgi:hypothetical protein